MNPCELSAAVSALAVTIACRLSDDELPLAAAVLTQLGDSLATISVQRTFCQNRAAAAQKCCAPPSRPDKP